MFGNLSRAGNAVITAMHPRPSRLMVPLRSSVRAISIFHNKASRSSVSLCSAPVYRWKQVRHLIDSVEKASEQEILKYAAALDRESQKERKSLVDCLIDELTEEEKEREEDIDLSKMKKVIGARYKIFHSDKNSKLTSLILSVTSL
jgi:hypothetical protein